MDVEEEEEEKKSEEPSKEEDDEYRETVEEAKREPENNDYDFDETEVDWNEQDGDQPMEVEAPNDVEESDDDGEEDHPFLLISTCRCVQGPYFDFNFRTSIPILLWPTSSIRRPWGVLKVCGR